MGDLAQFAKELDTFEQQVIEEVNDLSARLAIILFSKIVSRTPFRTGRARSSWQIAIGRPNPVFNQPGYYPQYADPSAAAALAMAEARTILATYKSGHFIKPTIWITNRLRYIPFLERGTSKITPVRMVALSIAELEAQYGQIRGIERVGMGLTIG